jgi:hypothetical protein
VPRIDALVASPCAVGRPAELGGRRRLGRAAARGRRDGGEDGTEHGIDTLALCQGKAVS